MPKGTREIKRRIKSVGNTRKITKAMEMVSAAKMRRAVSKVLQTRSYADLAWQTVLHLAKKIDISHHPFFRARRQVKNIGIVIISTNRGLCGSFNANLVAKVVESIKVHHPESQLTEVISLGTKGRDEARRRRLSLIADFPKNDISQDSIDIRPVAHMVARDFMEHKYDKVFVAYTDYESALKQVPHVKQLLPITAEVDERLGHIIHEKDKVEEIDIEHISEFVFEPGTRALLDAFLPRLVEVMIYQAVLESEASEHSARMMAMKNASEAAEEMIGDLTLAYNKARQAGITAELADISGGVAALE
jgi:F-type H+-transporting ATPase subunit gamma